jgi:AAA domain
MTDASGSGTEVIDAELVPVEKVPTRLTTTTIGRLKTRRVDQRVPYLNAMFYGDSGAGKTLLTGMAALIPEMSPVLFLDFEGGTSVLDHLGDEALNNIEVLPGTDADPLKWTDLQSIYDYLWKPGHPFKTVVMDSATEAQAVNIGFLLGYEGKVEIDAALPKFDEWNETTSQMRRMFRGFRDLKMNTLFTALPYEEPHPSSTKEHPRTIVRPSFSKKLRQEAPAFFDVVMYLYSKGRGRSNIRFVQTDRDETYTAKCRIPGVDPLIQGPTLEGLYDVLIRHPKRSTIDLSGATTKMLGSGSTGQSSEAPKMMRKKA